MNRMNRKEQGEKETGNRKKEKRKRKIRGKCRKINGRAKDQPNTPATH